LDLIEAKSGMEITSGWEGRGGETGKCGWIGTKLPSDGSKKLLMHCGGYVTTITVHLKKGERMLKVLA
jgi:hypothetical protein